MCSWRRNMFLTQVNVSLSSWVEGIQMYLNVLNETIIHPSSGDVTFSWKEMCVYVLTWRMQMEGHFEAHYGQDSQVHDAGDTKKEPYQSIIYTGGISTDPSVAPSRGHGQRVHRNCCSQVCHRQIHTQQLWGLHLCWLFDCGDDDQKVSNNGKKRWNTGRVNSYVTKSLVPLKMNM